MDTTFSRIILGCMGWGQWGKQLSKNEMIELLQFSVAHDLTSFDHADIYGDYTTETEFGIAFAESGIAREAIQIISKCGIQYIGNTRSNEVKHYQYDADYVIWSAEKSINDLQVDYLDLFLLHRPSPLMQASEIARAIQHLKREGKIRHFGVSNFNSLQIDLIASEVAIEVNQIEFSITYFDAMLDGTLNTMQLKNITPMSWSPLGQVFKEENEQTVRIKALLQELCAVYNTSEDQLLLAWVLKHPSSVHPVIGTTNKERILAAKAAIDIKLSEEDWFKMWVASQGHKVP